MSSCTFDQMIDQMKKQVPANHPFCTLAGFIEGESKNENGDFWVLGNVPAEELAAAIDNYNPCAEFEAQKAATAFGISPQQVRGQHIATFFEHAVRIYTIGALMKSHKESAAYLLKIWQLDPDQQFIDGVLRLQFPDEAQRCIVAAEMRKHLDGD